MPGMSGMELFARLPASLQQRVVFLSGGATSEQGRAFLERVERPTLQKPIGSAELRERVTQLLDAWRRVPR